MEWVDREFIAEVDAFLARHGGMAPATFGREALNEAAWYWTLKAGRSVGARNRQRVEAYMRERDAALTAPRDEDAA